MSALSTPGGGGTTAQSKPTSGKQKYQKLDINSLYCANRNENLEPSSVKSQLSRKHGMQSLGKVPSTRRPPANLPSLKTETGLDTNPIAAVAPSVSSPPTCINPPTQPTPAASISSVAASAGPGGWVSLPPPSSPHFRTEFPSLEAAAQPANRTDQPPQQPQLRPQTEGSWTSGGTTGGARQESNPPPAAAPAPTAASQQPPAYRAILPSFLVKGSTGVGLGLGGLGALRESRGAGTGTPGPPPGARPPPRAPPTPRAVEVLTARPILRDEQISSLDDMSRDAGWAQHDDIDYDQKLDFSDGETSTRKNNNRASIENERAEQKVSREAPEPGDEEQLWAERRQKQSNEVAQAVARARQRKEEEQRRRESRDPLPNTQQPKDFRDRNDRDRDRDRNDNREREPEPRERDRLESRDSRDRMDVRDRDRQTDSRDKERNDVRDRDVREKDRIDNRERDRNDRERFENRDRDNRDNRDARDRDRDRDKEPRDRGRNDNRDRPESDKDARQDIRDRDRGDNRDRADRERFERERDRGDRDRERSDRDRDRTDRDRSERDRDFRDRDRDHARDRDRDQNNPAFSKSFQANIPPRFLKQQQNRQQDDQPHKGWAFSGKPAPRRQEPPPQQGYNAPRHAPHNNGRRSYSRDFSDREDDFRRDKDGSGPQWRSEMQDYEKSGRELDRSNSKESYKDFNEYKGKNESDRKSSLEHAIEQSNRSAADKLSEVFERKSIGVAEPFATSESSAPSQTPEKQYSTLDNVSQRESAEKEVGKTSWAEVAQEETSIVLKPTEKVSPPRESEGKCKDLIGPNFDSRRNSQHLVSATSPPQNIPPNNTTYATAFHNQNKFNSNQTSSTQVLAGNNQQITQSTSLPITQQQTSQPVAQIQPAGFERQAAPKLVSQPPSNIADSFAASQMLKQQQMLSEQLAKLKYSQQSEKDATESVLVVSKPGTDVQNVAVKTVEISVEAVKITPDITKRHVDDKKQEVQSIHEPSHHKMPPKEPIERKSSGSGSEKKGRGFGGGSTAYAAYNSRGWGSRESRGRRSHRSSRSNNRASESDGSTDGAPNVERKERRRAPRSPRGPKKPDRPEDATRPPPTEPALLTADGMENREPFAPRGQPSRRGRGGFQGTARPPAPAKRVTSYGPPNTKSPFNQTNRAVKENEEGKDNSQMEDKGKGRPRPGSQATGRGRDRRSKGPVSGEDENWETTSEHSEGGGGRRRSVPGKFSQKGPGGRNQNNRNQNNPRNNNQGVKKDNLGENKTADVTEAMTDLKISTAKKDDEVADDGFQEVRNKKNSKDLRIPPVKEENPQASKQQPRSQSNHGNGRNGSSSRNPTDKSNPRGVAPLVNKNGQYDPRPRQANLAPRFMKQRQKQQLGMVSGYGPDTGAAPPPPAVNAWDKPIAQTLRGNIEESTEVVVKSAQSSQRSTPLETTNEIKPLASSCAVPADKSEVLDGTTPPVETIIFENTNYKSAPSEEALQQKYQMTSNITKPLQPEEIPPEMDAHPLSFNGADVRRPRSIQELIGDNGRPGSDNEASLGLQMAFDTTQKAEDSSDMKLDFAFDSDLGQLTEDKTAKSLGLPRNVHMSTSNTISPLAADLNLKIASVKKVWEMPAVAEGTEELQFAGFEEPNTETGAPPNVCKVKPTQQLQSPPPQHYNHVGYQGGYGGLSVPSPPAMLFNSSQQLLGSSQQLPQQGGLYGAFLDQSRGQFGGFPGTPYGAGSAAPYNYQPPPDMFQSLPNQYRMAATAGGGGFGQSGQLGNNPSTVLISSTSNSLMSATVKPSTQQIGAIGSKGGGVGGVGGVSAYQQQYLGYSAPVGDAAYSLAGLLPRPAPPQSSYYSPYQPPAAPAPTYPLQFTQQPQSGAFGSQFLSSQLQVAAAVQQMQQQQYRAPMQQQYAPAPPRPVPQQQLKSPLHEHANGFAPLCDSASPTPKQQQQQLQQQNKQKPPHSPTQHKYHAPPPHPPPPLTPHQHHQQQMVSGGSNGRCGGGGGGAGGRGGGMGAPRYPAPIQRPHAPALPLYRHAPPAQPPRAHHAPPQRHNLYYQHHQRNGGGGGERAAENCEPAAGAGMEQCGETTGTGAPPDAPVQSDLKAE